LHNAIIEHKLGLEGFFKIEAIQPDGSRKVLADWFPNLITDLGLNRWGTGDIVKFCGVGTGTAQPLATDTGLQTPLAFTTSGSYTATASTSSGAPPYSFTSNRTFNFAQGAVVGNISEVSVGWAGANGSAWSHARIKDGGGVDTTITVTAVEQLSVTYLLKINVPMADVVTVPTIGGVVTTATLRAANATNVGAWPDYSGGNGTLFDAMFINSMTTTYKSVGAYNGAIGAITGSPSGGFSAGQWSSADAYANNSLYFDQTFSFSTTQGNVAGGISAVLINPPLGEYQIGFAPAIAKDNTKTLTLTLRTSWARV
jgi:hypothetical protein